MAILMTVMLVFRGENHMKKWIVVFCLILFTGSAQAETNKLYLYTWDTYVAPQLFKKFERETGIEVITDVYSSNDALTEKLKSSAVYDVVVPSGNHVSSLVSENLLQALPEEIRHIGADLAKNVQKPSYDPAYAYALPLFYGTTGLAVNTKLVGEKISSWHQFFERPAGEKPSLGMLDDLATVMDIAALATAQPYCDAAPGSLEKIRETLLKQKPFVNTYGSTGYSERLVANEISLQMAWNGDVYKARQQNPAISYVYPVEGVEIWVDNLAIPARAKNIDAAKKFIAFLMEPENAAQYAVAAGMMPAVAAAQGRLPQEMKNAPEFNIPAGIPAFVAIACPPDVVRAYDQIWTNLTQ